MTATIVTTTTGMIARITRTGVTIRSGTSIIANTTSNAPGNRGITGNGATIIRTATSLGYTFPAQGEISRPLPKHSETNWQSGWKSHCFNLVCVLCASFSRFGSYQSFHLYVLRTILIDVLTRLEYF